MSEIKSPYIRETSRVIKLEQHPVLALGAALPRGNAKNLSNGHLGDVTLKLKKQGEIQLLGILL